MTNGRVDRWGVVGGGVLGLTLALRLAQEGHGVTVFERAGRLGGLASEWTLGDIVWDRYYHVILLSDSRVRGLLSELGLEEQLRWVETKTGFYIDGTFYSMSDTFEFLRFPPLDLISKLRLGATIFYASQVRNWRRLEEIPASDWLRRWSGRRTFEKIWLPLLRSKLGESYVKTSASFIWATIARMYAARRSGIKKEMFGFVPGGYARIFEAFDLKLREAGVRLELNAEIRNIGSDGSGVVTVGCADGEKTRFDRVAITAPATVASRLCPALSRQEHRRLNNVDYQGIVCASLLLSRPLGPYYITNITDSWVPFTAVIEMSSCVDTDQFAGHHLVYLPRYLPSGHPDFEVSDDEWRGRFSAALRRMYPDLEEEHILAFRVSRERYVYALPTLGYSKQLPPLQTSLPGVFLVNTAHVVNGTLNVNETLALADESLPILLGSAAARSSEARS